MIDCSTTIRRFQFSLKSSHVENSPIRRPQARELVKSCSSQYYFTGLTRSSHTEPSGKREDGVGIRFGETLGPQPLQSCKRIDIYPLIRLVVNINVLVMRPHCVSLDLGVEVNPQLLASIQNFRFTA